MPRYFRLSTLLFYFGLFYPLLADLYRRDKTAYTYLPESVKAFHNVKVYIANAKRGMTNAGHKSLSFGIAAFIPE
jgi:ubiquinone/menaquinone biosynthesis C-methylase UbiE